jgi:hypothetical protein
MVQGGARSVPRNALHVGNARRQELMEKSNGGRLAAEEMAELDGYVNIANVLSVMHSQARVA